MKSAILLHNPSAGNRQLSKKKLLAQIKSGGFKCSYFSTKNRNWKKSILKADFIIIAGGDGTVRKVAEELLKRKRRRQKICPLALLPLGTANNIAKTLGINGSVKSIISSWHANKIKKFDAGIIKKLKGHSFFLESFGVGVFAHLMKEMDKKKNKKTSNPAHQIKEALKQLCKIIPLYKSQDYELKLNGKDYSGSYILIEIMNTRSIGSNLFLSPFSDPGDSTFEVVLINEKNKDKFISYILNKIAGNEKKKYNFKIVRTKKAQIKLKHNLAHSDDELLERTKKTEARISLRKAAFKFLVS